MFLNLLKKMLVNVFQNKRIYKVPIILKDEEFNFPFKNQQTLIIINKAISEKFCEKKSALIKITKIIKNPFITSKLQTLPLVKKCQCN